MDTLKTTENLQKFMVVTPENCMPTFEALAERGDKIRYPEGVEYVGDMYIAFNKVPGGLPNPPHSSQHIYSGTKDRFYVTVVKKSRNKGESHDPYYDTHYIHYWIIFQNGDGADCDESGNKKPGLRLDEKWEALYHCYMSDELGASVPDKITPVITLDNALALLEQKGISV